MLAILSISVFWGFLLQQRKYLLQGSTDTKILLLQVGSLVIYLEWWLFLYACVWTCKRENYDRSWFLSDMKWNNLLNNKKKKNVCARTPFSFPACVLTSNHFTMAQGNFRWFEGRLPQNFCDTSSPRKLSSSEEKGEVSIRKWQKISESLKWRKTYH